MTNEPTTHRTVSAMQFDAKSDTTAALGRALFRARTSAHMSVRAAASGLGLSVNAYRMRETGASTMRSDEIIAAAKLFGVPPESLLDMNDDEAAGDQPAAD